METYTFVEIGGKKYPIKFGFNALRKYSMKTGTTLAQLNQIGEEMGLNDALVLIHCGIEDGYRAANGCHFQMYGSFRQNDGGKR